MLTIRDTRLYSLPPKEAPVNAMVIRIFLISILATFLNLADPLPAATNDLPRDSARSERVILTFFWGVGCPHCSRAKPFLEGLQKRYPRLLIQDCEVMQQRENIPRLLEMARRHGGEARAVPVFFIGKSMFSGFSDETAQKIEQEVSQLCSDTLSHPTPQAPDTTVRLPIIGELDPAGMSLPLFTIIIAGLDSFNPCAFFLLFFLLSLLVHAHSRLRMGLVGGLFVICSGLIYFLFMAAWLNLFLIAGQLAALTIGAGIVALILALINIKDFFFFKQGVSLTIPEQAKPGLFERMRGLVRSGSLPSMLAGTVVLAIVANSYELLCTAGFPMIFTRVLTLNNLDSASYYLYLALYNLVYVIPLLVIVAIFIITLGSRKISEWQGRVLKLISGTMMLGLGLVLLINPSLLNNPLVSIMLLAVVLLVSLAVALTTRRFFDACKEAGQHL